jgi:hypothetical protein
MDYTEVLEQARLLALARAEAWRQGFDAGVKAAEAMTPLERQLRAALQAMVDACRTEEGRLVESVSRLPLQQALDALIAADTPRERRGLIKPSSQP